MVKLISKKLLIISIIVSLFLPIVVYAMDSSTPTEDKKEFFYVDKTEVTQGEEIIMTLDLKQIEYNDFEFSLISNINLEEIISDEEEIDANIENNEFSIISNKSNISMEKIVLYYKIPEDMEIGTKITLLGKIKEVLEKEEIADEKVSEEIIEEEIETEVQDKENEDEIIETVSEEETVQENEEQEVTITITVVEKTETKEDDKKEDDGINDENNNEENNISKDEDIANKDQDNKGEISDSINKNEAQSQTQNQNQISSGNKMQNQITQTSGNISNSLSSKETITYNGESNNYLSSLTVSGYDLTPVFSKTNNTYFINVSDDVTSVEIQAEAEDTNATVKIYGNENLQEGDNKVLISVTAENGDVRIYRVYVVK